MDTMQLRMDRISTIFSSWKVAVITGIFLLILNSIAPCQSATVSRIQDLETFQDTMNLLEIQMDLCTTNVNFKKHIVCYYSGLMSYELIDPCSCTHLVLTNWNINDKQEVFNGKFEKLTFVRDLKRKNSKLKVLLSIHANLSDSADNNTFLQLMANTNKNNFTRNLMHFFNDGSGSDLCGVELDLVMTTAEHKVLHTKLLQVLHDAFERRMQLHDKFMSKYLLATTVSMNPEDILTAYDINTISRYADLVYLPAYNFSTLDVNKTRLAHHSRLMGIADVANADSMVDLVISLGLDRHKIVLGIPAFGVAYTLLHSNETKMNSPAGELSHIFPYNQLCDFAASKTWTKQREEDQTEVRIYNSKLWISYDDALTVGIKSKFALLRDLSGVGFWTIDDDVHDQSGCRENVSLINAAKNTFAILETANQKKVMESLEKDFESSNGHTDEHAYRRDRRSSIYRVTQIIDRSGKIHMITDQIQTMLQCTRQGYYRHPQECGQFYRCVKFNQYREIFTIFEYDCPLGLVFDERWEVCSWPSVAPPCYGSNEIFAVPTDKFVCPTEGLFRDPTNCRWFYKCTDFYGDGLLSTFEFRCPYDLAFDEENLICTWRWLIPSCGGDLGRFSEGRHAYEMIPAFNAPYAPTFIFNNSIRAHRTSKMPHTVPNRESVIPASQSSGRSLEGFESKLTKLPQSVTDVNGRQNIGTMGDAPSLDTSNPNAPLLLPPRPILAPHERYRTDGRLQSNNVHYKPPMIHNVSHETFSQKETFKPFKIDPSTAQLEAPHDNYPATNQRTDMHLVDQDPDSLHNNSNIHLGPHSQPQLTHKHVTQTDLVGISRFPNVRYDPSHSKIETTEQANPSDTQIAIGNVSSRNLIDLTISTKKLGTATHSTTEGISSRVESDLTQDKFEITPVKQTSPRITPPRTYITDRPYIKTKMTWTDISASSTVRYGSDNGGLDVTAQGSIPGKHIDLNVNITKTNKGLQAGTAPPILKIFTKAEFDVTHDIVAPTTPETEAVSMIMSTSFITDILAPVFPSIGYDSNSSKLKIMQLTTPKPRKFIPENGSSKYITDDSVITNSEWQAGTPSTIRGILASPKIDYDLANVKLSNIYEVTPETQTVHGITSSEVLNTDRSAHIRSETAPLDISRTPSAKYKPNYTAFETIEQPSQLEMLGIIEKVVPKYGDHADTITTSKPLAAESSIPGKPSDGRYGMRHEKIGTTAQKMPETTSVLGIIMSEIASPGISTLSIGYNKTTRPETVPRTISLSTYTTDGQTDTKSGIASPDISRLTDGTHDVNTGKLQTIVSPPSIPGRPSNGRYGMTHGKISTTAQEMPETTSVLGIIKSEIASPGISTLSFVGYNKTTRPETVPGTISLRTYTTDGQTDTKSGIASPDISRLTDGTHDVHMGKLQTIVTHPSITGRPSNGRYGMTHGKIGTTAQKMSETPSVLGIIQSEIASPGISTLSFGYNKTTRPETVPRTISLSTYTTDGQTDTKSGIASPDISRLTDDTHDVNTGKLQTIVTHPSITGRPSNGRYGMTHGKISTTAQEMPETPSVLGIIKSEIASPGISTLSFVGYNKTMRPETVPGTITLRPYTTNGPTDMKSEIASPDMARLTNVTHYINTGTLKTIAQTISLGKEIPVVNESMMYGIMKSTIVTKQLLPETPTIIQEKSPSTIYDLPGDIIPQSPETQNVPVTISFKTFTTNRPAPISQGLNYSKLNAIHPTSPPEKEITPVKSSLRYSIDDSIIGTSKIQVTTRATFHGLLVPHNINYGLTQGKLSTISQLTQQMQTVRGITSSVFTTDRSADSFKSEITIPVIARPPSAKYDLNPRKVEIIEQKIPETHLVSGISKIIFATDSSAHTDKSEIALLGVTELSKSLHAPIHGKFDKFGERIDESHSANSRLPISPGVELTHEPQTISPTVGKMAFMAKQPITTLPTTTTVHFPRITKFDLNSADSPQGVRGQTVLNNQYSYNFGEPRAIPIHSLDEDKFTKPQTLMPIISPGKPSRINYVTHGTKLGDDYQPLNQNHTHPFHAMVTINSRQADSGTTANATQPHVTLLNISGRHTPHENFASNDRGMDGQKTILGTAPTGEQNGMSGASFIKETKTNLPIRPTTQQIPLITNKDLPPRLTKDQKLVSSTLKYQSFVPTEPTTAFINVLRTGETQRRPPLYDARQFIGLTTLPTTLNTGKERYSGGSAASGVGYTWRMYFDTTIQSADEPSTHASIDDHTVPKDHMSPYDAINIKVDPKLHQLAQTPSIITSGIGEIDQSNDQQIKDSQLKQSNSAKQGIRGSTKFSDNPFLSKTPPSSHGRQSSVGDENLSFTQRLLEHGKNYEQRITNVSAPVTHLFNPPSVREKQIAGQTQSQLQQFQSQQTRNTTPRATTMISSTIAFSQTSDSNGKLLASPDQSKRITLQTIPVITNHTTQEESSREISKNVLIKIISATGRAATYSSTSSTRTISKTATALKPSQHGEGFHHSNLHASRGSKLRYTNKTNVEPGIPQNANNRGNIRFGGGHSAPSSTNVKKASTYGLKPFPPPRPGTHVPEKDVLVYTSISETYAEPITCERPGLFRHPSSCNEFYECYYDRWIHKYTIHFFDCPVKLVYDNRISACNWPAYGPSCLNQNI